MRTLYKGKSSDLNNNFEIGLKILIFDELPLI